MKTYLIFFGKSQDFTFHAFDRNGLISDFNTIIKDFDLLESVYFSTDDVSNKEVLAKYNFTSPSGTKFSLLKLYSPGQALDGNRIAGSTYGVALLSEEDILFSKKNISLLKVSKENFAKLSLNGLKFNKSNFIDDAFKIWSAIVNSKEGNYLDTVNFGSNLFLSSNQLPRAYFVNSIYDDLIDLENEINHSKKIYVTNDLDHLVRANKKWGDSFPILTKSITGWVKYKEPKNEQPNPVESYVPRQEKQNSDNDFNDIGKLKIQLSDLKYERDIILKEGKEKIDVLKRQNRIFIYANVIQFLLIIIFLLILFIKKKPEVNEGDEVKDKAEENTAQAGSSIVPTNLQDISLFFIDSNYYKSVRKIVLDFEKLVEPNIDSLSREKLKEELYFNYKVLGIDTIYANEKIKGLLEIYTKRKATSGKGPYTAPKR